MAKKAKYKKIQIHGNTPTKPVDHSTASIIITQPKRGSLDIGDYMTAFKQAENVDKPSRAKLHDIHAEIITDAHLYAVIQKRKAAVLNTPIEFSRDGVVDEKIEEQIRSPWFSKFLSDLLDTEQYGNSLFQFRREGDWLNYDMIPRKNYDPVRRIILQRQSDTEGESFDNFSDLILVGDPRDLGLLTKAAPYVIYKRNAMSDFAQFIELYAHPLKEGTYDAWDEDIRKKLLQDLFDAGGSTVFVHPNGTNVNLHDTTSKGATGELYGRAITLFNDELSKLELGNTLTTEVGDKGTQALGTVHQAGEDKITRMSKQFVLNVLNYELTDIFANLGFDTRGGEFSFVVPQLKDLSSRIQIDLQLKAMGLPISHDYLYETYGIPKPDKTQEVIGSTPQPQDPERKEQDPKPDPDPKEEEKNKTPQQIIDEKEERKQRKTFKNWLRNFFVSAPKKGALEW